MKGPDPSRKPLSCSLHSNNQVPNYLEILQHIGLLPCEPWMRRCCITWQMMSNSLPPFNLRKSPRLMAWWMLSPIFSIPFPQKNIEKLGSSTSTQDYLIATFHWSWFVNRQLHESTLIIQQYKKLIAKFEEQKQWYYNDIYKQGYFDGKDSLRISRTVQTYICVPFISAPLLFQHYSFNLRTQLHRTPWPCIWSPDWWPHSTNDRSSKTCEDCIWIQSHPAHH